MYAKYPCAPPLADTEIVPTQAEIRLKLTEKETSATLRGETSWIATGLKLEEAQ